MDRALKVAPRNPAIYHNAACALGELRGALDAIRGGVERGDDDVTIASIREDDDLAPTRGAAFDAILGRSGEPVLLAWADGFTAAELSQFREAVRTTLPDPDLSKFDEGTVARVDPDFGIKRELDLHELAAECRAASAIECSELVHRRIHMIFRH